MKRNVNYWEEVQIMADNFFDEKDEFKQEEILGQVLTFMKPYIEKSARNAEYRGQFKGVKLPYEDFISAFYEALWSALKSYDPEKGKFSSLYGYRLRIAEASVWRKYETKGTENDKDGKSYISARLDSLEAHIGADSDNNDLTLEVFALEEVPSAEEQVVEDEEEEAFNIVREFYRCNQRYAEIIAYLYKGYEGDDLAEILGFNEYNANLRKTVQRAKNSFSKFMEKRGA
ncbi:hypothetical protein CHL76_02295 [Marinococcus halophilus]|uniref:RNA polymerase sigma-70 region 2 domain-containing protein n=1 Tax=Marinococcus halophilus TaxID=1371 RepID=A0A510Y1F9_MARHA|nr:hypothetical protein [Marinococcus halophilus]OZT81207.1 hypothetical protein CHL76_02295 [Marinococcus halophilus]GEK57140.1 hypothetical protein MHA01_00450 [Marinococcus halophilus]